ncbi:ABC transporter permease [Myceligenerans pegani]|uniref:ABC transporter permease n=1 Tax=Myceligenerans pegani TaxID=2776917 RepID=A0ABR9N4G2_9MICO|nr:ABC transporter permease [Myceligenerans sp. TRM 65318]MBE1878554.1 ABC transporter permease [Myceligenerans sp. TRM 65318]MBE3020825.1 ABC transporter permease [Myceligenerans sp. TRM 65318]
MTQNSAAAPAVRPLTGRTGRRRHNAWTVRLCAAILVLVVAVAVLAPWITPYDPYLADFGSLWLPPSPDHWLGTDQLGRDMLSRLIAGARQTMLGAIALLALATVVGVTVGITAAWQRGWVDAVLGRVTDVMFAFPGLLFVILVIAVFDSGTGTAVVGMALAYAPAIARFTRAVALDELARPYIASYRLQGAGGLVICVRYLLPNMVSTLLGYLVVLFGEGLMSLAALNFIGFGAQPPSADWGLMVAEARNGVIQGYLGPALVPGLTIAVVVVATNVVGLHLSDKLAVRK